MKVTRDVILDLLPLYLADEASEDTRVLVAKYLETDPELARLAAESAKLLPDDSPVPLTTEDQMKAYLAAKQLMFRRNLTWAIMIGLVLAVILALAFLAAVLLFFA